MTIEQNPQEFIVTARKWRPLVFKDVVGQEHITNTLSNAIRMNRVHHSYLFSGPRGVGKTTTARILARAVNCENPTDTEPCNKCASCISILEGRSLDVIEIDGASNNSVDDVRKLRENAKYPPVTGKYKMYIIDEVHMLSTSAFNALLKTLEEPPPHLIFVFATTEQHKVPATILSRCQRHEFRRMEIDDIARQLRVIATGEKIEIDEEAVLTIAKKADGSMRDGESIFDQVVAFCGKDIKYADMADALHLIDQDFFFRISSTIKSGDMSEMFQISNEVVTKGYDLQECLGGLLEHFRNLLVVKATGSTGLIENSGATKDRYMADAEAFSKADLLRIMNLISTTEQALRFAPQPKIKFELALLQLTAMDSAVELSQLLKEVKKLKSIPESHGDPNKVLQDFQQSFTPVKKNLNIEAEIEPDEIVSPDNPNPEEEQPVNTVQKPKINGANADVLRNGWKDFLNKYGSSEFGFQILNQKALVLPDFYNNEIILKVTSEFTEENLKKKKDNIAHSLSEFFGTSISLKILKQDYEIAEDSEMEQVGKIEEEIAPPIENKNIVKEINKENMADSSNEVNSKVTKSAKHPVEQEIIELFGAKEIEPNDK